MRFTIIAVGVVVGMSMFSQMGSFTTTGTEEGTIDNTKGYGGRISSMKKIVEAHWQGMEVVPLTWELAAKLGIPLNEKGVLVDEVTLAAQESGLMAKDIVKSINGIPLETLEEFYAITRQVRNQSRASLNVNRGPGKTVTIDLVGLHELGIAQLESAPMILAGAIPPHRYRGPCTDCHSVGSTGELIPDPGNITLTPPPISIKTKNPHRNRGNCKLCHIIK